MTRFLFPALFGMALGISPLPAEDAATTDYSPTSVVDARIAERGHPRMAFDSSGSRLAVSLKKKPGDQEGRVWFLNVPDLAIIREIVLDAEPYSLAFSPSGDLFALSVARETPTQPLRLAVLSTSEWKTVYSDRELNYPVSSLAFDPVGDLLYVGGSDRRELVRLEVGTWTNETIPGLRNVEEGCQALALAPDGQTAAMGSFNSNLYVWAMDDTQEAKKLGSQRFRGAIGAVTFSGDSRFLAAGDSRGQVMVFYRTSDGLWAWKSVFNVPAGGVTGLAFLNDNSLVTSDAYGLVARWNLEETRTPIEAMNLGAGNAQAIAVDAKGNWMAVGGEKIQLFPVGTPLSPAEMPSVPLAVVESAPPPAVEHYVSEVPSVSMSPDSPPSAPGPGPSGIEDLRSFLIWMALDKEGGGGEEWVQSWAAHLDGGLYNPIQLALPFETLTAAVFRSNITHLDAVFAKDDFLVFYSHAVLSPTAEKGDYPLAVGPYLNERVLLSEWLKTLQGAAAKGPVLWFIDLIQDPKMEDSAASALFQSVVRRISLVEESVAPVEPAPKRGDIGAGLVTLSKEGCYRELAGNLKEALSGKADANGDGRLFDRELLLFLADRCRTALRANVVGDSKYEIPILPPFRLDNP